MSQTKFNISEVWKKAKTGDAAAIEDLRKHASSNNLAAMFFLGIGYLEGLFSKEKNHEMLEEAKKWLLKAGEAGSREALFALGVAYMNGGFSVSATPDVLAAKEWFEKAAEAGEIKAMFNLGLGCLKGAFSDIEGSPDYNRAKKWFEEAASKGDVRSMYNLGLGYAKGDFSQAPGKPDYLNAKEWYEKSANKGFSNAMLNLGAGYKRGYFSEGGGQPDFEKARGWYEKAAEAGNSIAMVNLGLGYARGDYSDQSGAPDNVKSKYWFERAAAEGNSGAMYYLGMAYASGDFLGDDNNPNTKAAEEWFLKAAELGHVKSMFRLGLMYITGGFDNGDPSKADHVNAKKWLLKAAEHGYEEAWYLLGVGYEAGYFSDVLGEPDFKNALSYYEKAASNGDARSSNACDLMRIVLQLPADLQREVAEKLSALVEVQNKILRSHSIAQEPGEAPVVIAHYTKWDAVKSILTPENEGGVGANHLRLYHVDYMNDPDEGRRLLSICDDAIAVSDETQKWFSNLFKKYYFDKTSTEEQRLTSEILPSVYMVSFTEEVDQLSVWRSYGDEAKGFAVVLPITDVNKEMFAHRDYDTAWQRAMTSNNNTRPGDIKDSVASSGEMVTGASGNVTERFESIDNPDESAVNRMPLYRVLYSKEDVVKTLNSLYTALDPLKTLKSSVDESLFSSIENFIAELLVGLLYLYKSPQYQAEKEVRGLMVWKLNDATHVMFDECDPRRLYCKSPPILFQVKGSKIIVGPKSPMPERYIWDIRQRLTHFNLTGGGTAAETTSVSRSEVRYR